MSSLFGDSIYTDNNPYGYRINVNHPKVRNKYNRYKTWKGVPLSEPLSDEQRLEFEIYLLKKRQKQ